jgi:hypothetical protein
VVVLLAGTAATAAVVQANKDAEALTDVLQGGMAAPEDPGELAVRVVEVDQQREHRDVGVGRP